MLSALALETKRLNIGILVSSNTFRHPSLLAKMATTVDLLSGGRLILGLGTGVFPLEHQMYGLPFPPVGERMDRLQETLEVLKFLWTRPGASFRGRYYQLEQALLEPKPAQKPHPPIVIGGRGEKRLIPMAARYADGWNVTGTFAPPEILSRKVRILQDGCREAGREPDEVEISIALFLYLDREPDKYLPAVDRWGQSRGLSPEDARSRVLLGTPSMVCQQIEAFRQVGVTHFILTLPSPMQIEAVRLFGEEVMPFFTAKRE